MINPEQLNAFLEKLDKGVAAVDLLKIGQHYALNGAHQTYNVKTGTNLKTVGRFRVALDMEQCLDRFYGGYYSDWACGGQWNRALQFVQLLATAFNTAHIEVIAFFDGTLKENKRLQHERNDFRQKAVSVLKHIRMIGTPPPKVWWLPPSGIRTTLRNALRTVNIQVVQTIHDHTMELIDYFHEHRLHAIIGLHPDYLIAQVSRYFSSHDLRLSYKGALETKEFFPSKLLVALQLNRDQLAILAVLLGGYILLDDNVLREIYKKINVEYNTDFESRIKRLADVIRTAPQSVDDFINKLNLQEFAPQLKESIEYYQRKGAFSGKRYLGNKKKAILSEKPENSSTKEVVPMASETSESDVAANKLLNETIDEDRKCQEMQEKSDCDNSKGEKLPKKSVKFVYTLPAEVIRTAAERHKRGIMDSRIYILLVKKEIVLPQLLEDEQYREFPSVHHFYRPARQMIYAILFNLYHQKYMHQKGGHRDKDGSGNTAPEIIINEWIWSLKNEYKTPEKVPAVQINWAVPTVQRLWFGTAHEDKQRRMKAFLTIMRSDNPLMLNKNYVPQHLLVLACVLRYIVSNPERSVMTSIELEAFIATAFSTQLINVEYTQEMVLPSVHLRGVYLATLFMQGVETAQLANDSCGVPLPWSMTNPWLFFDGKLFHLKLKMSTFATNLRELCDDLVDVMLKVERFKKAVLEDIEHLLPLTQIDPLFRQGFFGQSSQNQTQSTISPQLYKNLGFSPLQSNLFGLGSGFYGAQASQPYELPTKSHKTSRNTPTDYQLKVGGIVVGSWAHGPANRGLLSANRAKYPINKQRMQKPGRITIQAPGNPNCYRIVPNGYAIGGLNKSTQKLRANKQQKKSMKPSAYKNIVSKASKPTGPVKIEKKSEGANNDKIEELVEKVEKIDLTSNAIQQIEDKNGLTTETDLESTVVKICDKILKDDDDVQIDSIDGHADFEQNSNEADDATFANGESTAVGDALNKNKKIKKNKKGQLKGTVNLQQSPIAQTKVNN